MECGRSLVLDVHAFPLRAASRHYEEEGQQSGPRVWSW